MTELRIVVDSPAVERLAEAIGALAAAIANANAGKAQASPAPAPAQQPQAAAPAQTQTQAAPAPLDKAMGLAESPGANIGRQAADAACRRLVGETYQQELGARPDWQDKFNRLSAHLFRLASTISGGRTQRPAQLTEGEARRFAEEAALLEWGEDGNVRTKMPF